MNKKIISIIIGVILAILLVIGGFLLFQSRFGRAADYTPENVEVTVEDSDQQSTAKICWETKADSASIVHYGTSVTALNLVDYDKEDTNLKKKHCVTLTGLASGTTYYFCIPADPANKDKCVGDVPLTFTTKPKVETPPSSATPSATLTPAKSKLTATPTPEEEEEEPIPTIDESAVKKAIETEYKYWDPACMKEYPFSYCAQFMPRVTATPEQKAQQ